MCSSDLTDYPDAKPLFAHTSMPKQQQMLKGALVMVVENLRKPEVLSGSLKGLGARHVKYGALPEHYPLVGNSLLKTLGQYAGHAWTPELKEAWTGAYGAITELMLEGADYSKADVELDSSPAAATPAPGADSAAVPLVGAGATTLTSEPPQGISNTTAAGIIGGGGVLLLLMLILL